MTTPFRPRLRDDLLLDDEGAYDPALDRRINLGPVPRVIAQALDGERTLDEVLGAVRARHPEIGPERVEGTVRSFLLLLLVEGAGLPTLGRARRLKAGEEPWGERLLPGTRFACQGSGDCCTHYHYGPLFDDDLEVLRALDLQRFFPHLDGEPFLRLPVDDPEGRLYLRSRSDTDERCTFQLADLRCGIHAHFGESKKPRVCRLYPWDGFPALDGLRIFDRGECSSYAASSVSGATLDEALPELRPLLGNFNQMVRHPLLAFPGGVLCDAGLFLRFTDVACELLAGQRGDAGQTLRAVGRLLDELVEGLRQLPLAAGEPERTAERILGADPARLFAPRPVDLPEAARLLAETAELALQIAVQPLRLGDRAEEIARGPASFGIRLNQRYRREASTLVHIVAVVARCRAEGAPLPEHLAPLAEVVIDPSLDEALKRSQRQSLFGLETMLDDCPAAGMVRLALIHLVTVWGARFHAAERGVQVATALDWNFGHSRARRILGRAQCDAAFLTFQAVMAPLLEALPELV